MFGELLASSVIKRVLCGN